MEPVTMTKQEVDDLFLNLRFTEPVTYFWKGTDLWSKRKVSNLFGTGFTMIEEPVRLQWRGQPVQVTG